VRRSELYRGEKRVGSGKRDGLKIMPEYPQKKIAEFAFERERKRQRRLRETVRLARKIGGPPRSSAFAQNPSIR